MNDEFESEVRSEVRTELQSMQTGLGLFFVSLLALYICVHWVTLTLTARRLKRVSELMTMFEAH